MTKPKMKLVRVNEKTLIEVRASIPDDAARVNFLEKTTRKDYQVVHSLDAKRKQGIRALKDIPRRNIVFSGDNTSRENIRR